MIRPSFRPIANSPGHMSSFIFLVSITTPARLAQADAAVQTALRLRPDGGEAHLARAENLYHGLPRL